MLKDISIGRYYDAESTLHRMDPRVKLILFAVYMTGVFMISKPEGILASFIVVLGLVVLSRIPFRVIIRSVRPIIFLMLFVFVINLLTMRDGRTILRFWIVRITDYGLERASVMTLRLFLLIVSTTLLLSLTTTPLKMADGLESLFAPLKKIRVPVHEMAMMMSIALRFIPILLEETNKIMKAQLARGADFETGNIIKRVKAMIPILIPLFVAAFRRANDLAMAMEARCYKGGEGRTKMKPLKYKGRDFLAYFILISYFVGMLFLGWIDFIPLLIH